MFRAIQASVLLVLFSSTLLAQEGNYSNAAIEKLNLQFRQYYAQAREERLAAIDPVVVARGDSLVLLHEGKRIEGTTVPANYHDLKTVAHIPLAIFCVLGEKDNQQLDERTLTKLSTLKKHMLAVLTELEDSFADPRLRQLQLDMISECIKLIDASTSTRTCTQKQLSTFIDQVRPIILENVESATRLRIDNYHEQMLQWRKQLNQEEWKRLYVVIPGASLARKNETAVQYFSKLLGERGEGKRIIYAEAQFEESKDLQLLGTYILDTEVGIAFFGDPWRMQRDLLASAADSYLDSLDFTP